MPPSFKTIQNRNVVGSFVLTRRSAASGDENGCMQERKITVLHAGVTLTNSELCCLNLEITKT